MNFLCKEIFFLSLVFTPLYSMEEQKKKTVRFQLPNKLKQLPLESKMETTLVPQGQSTENGWTSIDLNTYEFFSGSSFKELINTAAHNHVPFFLAQTTIKPENGNRTYFFYTAHRLNEQLNFSPRHHRYGNVPQYEFTDPTSGKMILGPITYWRINNTNKEFKYFETDQDLFPPMHSQDNRRKQHLKRTFIECAYNACLEKHDKTLKAITTLGHFYAKECSEIEVHKDYARARELLKISAKQGDPAAQNTLGWLLYDGKGGKRDRYLAIDYFMKSVKQGEPAAHYNIGTIFMENKNLNTNLDKMNTTQLKKLLVDIDLALGFFEVPANQAIDEAVKKDANKKIRFLKKRKEQIEAKQSA